MITIDILSKVSVAIAMVRVPDPKVRAKFDMAKKLWMESLNQAVNQGSREDDAFGFVPSEASVMDTGWSTSTGISPMWPYGPLMY